MPTQYQEDLPEIKEIKVDFQKAKDALEKKSVKKKDASTSHPAYHKDTKAYSDAKAAYSNAFAAYETPKLDKTSGYKWSQEACYATQPTSSLYSSMPSDSVEGRRHTGKFMGGAALERELEKVLDTTEPMMEIKAKIMEIKANDEIGEKLGRATARYYDRMMEYLQDEGFSREESIQLLCSMVRNNNTGG